MLDVTALSWCRKLLEIAEELQKAFGCFQTFSKLFISVCFADTFYSKIHLLLELRYSNRRQAFLVTLLYTTPRFPQLTCFCCNAIRIYANYPLTTYSCTLYSMSASGELWIPSTTLSNTLDPDNTLQKAKMEIIASLTFKNRKADY